MSMKEVRFLLFVFIFFVSLTGSAISAEYVGSDTCFKCHPDQHNDFRVSGHPYKIQKVDTVKFWPLPLPKGYSWDDISYVIGGATKKARYMDKKGYIITAAKDGSDLKAQYNLADGSWSYYEKGKKKKYDCGPCHMTNFKKEGMQDGLEGIVGTWTFAGIQCEECHGAGGDHAMSADKTRIKVDKSAAACGKCHIRGSKDKIPAKGGFIEHHEQYNEMLAGPHKGLDCVTCHNPHKKAHISVKKDCASCHSKQAADYKGSVMEAVGVSCADCHMPKATKSAVNKSKLEGDVMTHTFKINVDPKAAMFYKEPKLDKDGKQVMDKDGKPEMNEFAKGFVTLDFACLNCHKNKDVKWAAKKAGKVHSYGRLKVKK